MIELTTLQLIAMSSLAFLGLWHLFHWLLLSLQSFMAPHIHIAALTEERACLRSALRAARAYVPTTGSEGVELHDAITDLLDDSTEYKAR